MTPPRRAKLVLLVLAIAFVGLGVWAWEPVYLGVTTKHIWSEFRQDGHAVRGWEWVRRWTLLSDHPKAMFWYVETGFKACAYEHSPILCVTDWHVDGTVKLQQWTVPGGKPTRGRRIETKSTPPWRWGVTDQTAPSMPAWMKDDAKWQAALDAQE